ncbi:MAG: hypothetical protein GY801_53335 [bacterium]|nr:hypothetical protein [bacterium]
MVSRRSSPSRTTSGVSSDTLSFGDNPHPQNVSRLKPAIGSVFSALQPACALRRALDRSDTVCRPIIDRVLYVLPGAIKG